MFYLEMLTLISILICNEHFHMTNIVRVKHVKTIYNMKSKPLSQTLGPGSVFLILSLQSKSWVLDLGSWALGFGS